MMHGPPTFARLVAWSVLLFGLSMGCGQGCGDPTPNPPAAREMPDADRSTVVLSRAQGVRANGEDSVDIQVRVLKEDGTPLPGRTVQVTVSGEGNTVAQPAGPTDEQGVASAKLVSTVPGVKTVTASVEAEGGPVTLSSRPTVEFIRLPASRLAFTSAPSSGTAGVGLGTFEVTIQNADGDTIQDATATVTVAIGSGPSAATLKGTVSVAAVNGVARFDGLVLEKAARDYTLVANAGSLTGATSPLFDVVSAAPVQLVLRHSGLPVTAGVPESVEVFARDVFGNDAAGYTGTVHFSSDDGSATLPGDYTFTAADQGRHVFTGGLIARLAGARRLTVTDLAEAAFTSSLELAVVPGAVKKLVFTGPLADRSVRASFGVQVALTDEFGNRVQAGTPAVTLSANKAGRVTGLGTVSPVDGVASFSGLSIAEEDTGYVLTASAPGVESGSSNPFTIVDDVPPSRPVLAQTGNTPSSITVSWEPVGDDGLLGTPSSYELRYSTSDIVTDVDFENALPVAPPVAPPTPSDTTRVVTIPGLLSNTTYSVALRVTDNQGNAVRSVSLAASTMHLTARQVAFIAQPQSGKAGVALAPITVEIQDAAGLRVDNAALAVTLTVQGTTGYGPFTVISDKGVATFTGVRIDTAGTGYTLRATSTSLTPADSQTFDITHAEAARLGLAGLGATVRAGDDNTVTVTVRDAFDNFIENYTGTVSFASSDTAASLPVPYTFLAADKGQHTFGQVVLRTSGTQTLTVSAPGLPDATLSTDVGHANPSKLLLTGLPAEMRAGDSPQVSVEVRDGFGNRATGYTGTVVFSSTDSRATLPGEYTFIAADNGFKQFPVTLVTAGARSVTVQDKATPATLNATADTTVKWAPVASLVLEAPASVVAGNPLSMKVTATDAHGNTVEDYTQTVSFSADADRATVPAAYPFALSDAGSRQFGFTLEKAVTTKLTVTDGAGLSAIHTVSVSPASAASLVLVAPTGPLQAGVAFTVDVTLKDAFGNVDTGYTGTVGFTSSDPAMVPPADGAFTGADAGHKSFSVTLKTAGQQSLTVTDLARAFLTATASSLQVDPGPARKLVFRDQPTNGRVRTKLAPVTVAITDDFGNTVDVDTPDLTLALSGGNPSSVLAGGTPAVRPSRGVATFDNLTVDQQGTGFQLGATGGSLIGASSTPFDIVDDVAPGAVSLNLVDKTSIQVELHWVAVGDDGTAGIASSYELRYATSPVDTAPAGSITSVTLGQPQAPPLDESVIVTGLSPSTTYYFQLKVLDDVGNTTLATLNTATNADPCAVVTCTPPAPTCAPDGISRVTYTETCADVANTATCQQSQTSTACPGPDAVCFNGACDSAASPGANQLSISEVMHSPSSGVTEYLELTNNTGNLLNLNGLTVLYRNSASVTSSFTVSSGSSVPLVVDRKGTFVLAQNKDAATNGGVSANYQYGGGIGLEGSGRFILQSQSGITVEDFQYTPSFPQTLGKAMNLSAFVVGTKATAQPWYWCDSETPIQTGGDLGTPNARNATCGVPETPAVEWCNLQYPKAFPSGDGNYPATITPGSSWSIYSRFYSPGVTTRNQAGNDYYPHVSAELGYGTDPAAPAGWTWTPVSPNGGYPGTSGNDDEMMGTLSIPSAGTYHYGFRYRIWNPATSSYNSYVYCDQSGVATPPAGTYGTVVVTAPVLTNHVVISEFSGGNGSATAAERTDEFIELYNPTNSPVDLNGWTVQYKSATNTTSYTGSVTIDSTTAPGGTIIQPRGYFLLVGATYSGSVSADATYSIDTSASTTTGGHVRIGPALDPANLNDSNTVDKLGWGTANQPEGTAAPFHPAAGGSLERKAYSTSTAATMEGGADASRGNGTDSNDNGNDFVVRTVRDPQNRASPTESP